MMPAPAQKSFQLNAATAILSISRAAGTRLLYEEYYLYMIAYLYIMS